MKFYFNLFNQNERQNFIYEEEKIIKTNLTSFNVKFYLDEIVDAPINECLLIIEKESDGKWIFNNKSSSEINELIEYKNIEFKNVIEPNEKYRIYFELKQGGVTVINTLKNAIYFILNTMPSDFEINIDNSIQLDKIYELQEVENNLLKFNLKVKNNNNFEYFYTINPEEKIEATNFMPLLNNIKSFSEELSASMFKDGFTYLHFFLKDTFNNIKHKKYKITTKNNTFAIMYLLENEIQLHNQEEEFGIFYESRNVTEIAPIIQYEKDENGVQKKGKSIGTFNKENKSFIINLKEQFGEVPVKEFELFFLLNNNDNLTSNSILVRIDDEKPVVELQEYLLVKDKNKNEIEINGKIKDKGLFFLGNSIKIIEPKKNLFLIQSSEKLSKIRYSNGKEYDLEKFENYYSSEYLDSSFDILDNSNNVVLNYKKINSSSNKEIFIWIDKNKLTLFEQNLLANNNLKIKGGLEEKVISQEVIEFDNLLILKAKLSEDTSGYINFDLGVNSFDYSFLYYINNFNISADLNNKKELNLNFKNTKIIISKNEKTEIVKFNEKKIVSTKKGVFNNWINFLAVSYNENEKFISKYNSVFFDQDLNQNNFKEVYFKPKLKKDNEVINYNFYNCKKISEGLFNFETSINIEDGLNKFIFVFEDSLGNEIEKPFIVEKNYEQIKTEVLKSNDFNIYLDDGVTKIVSRKDTTNINFVLKNETKLNKEKDVTITVKGQDIIKYQKISKNDNNRIFNLNFKCEETEKTFDVIYDETNEVIGKISIIKKNELLFNVPEKIISGLNTYYLYLEKDAFSKISVNYLNPSFQINILENKLEIIRNNNLKILEEFEMEINVFDDKGIYNSVSRNVKCYFFNDNVIDRYFILNHKTNEIPKNTFDLKLILNNAESVEYLRLYDKSENKLNKKFKYGKITGNECLIEGITTPIKESSFDVEFKIKDTEIVVKKEIFKENPVKFIDEGKYFKTSIEVIDKISVKVLSDVLNDYKIKIKENGELLLENILRHKIEDYSLNIKSNHIITDISIEILNKENKIIYFNKKIFNLLHNSLENTFIENLKEKDVKVKNLFNNINLIGAKKSYNYYLLITDSEMKSKKINLNLGNNNIDTLDVGDYFIELIESKFNFKKVIQTSFVKVVEKLEDYITFSTAYSKFKFAEQIYVELSKGLTFNYLNPMIEHITDKKKIIIYPEFKNNRAEFNFKKEKGLNRFVYKDIFQTKELKSTIVQEEKNLKINVFDLNTKEKSLFFEKDKNNIILERRENVYFKVDNCDEIIIKPTRLRNEIKRNVIDNLEITIYKEFIPCVLDFYKNNEKLNSITINIEEQNKLIVPLWNTNKEKFIEVIPFKIRTNRIIKDTIQLTMKNRTKHFLYSFTILKARELNKKVFLNLSLDEQEEFIKDCSSKIYEEYGKMDTDLIKKEITKELKLMEDFDYDRE